MEGGVVGSPGRAYCDYEHVARGGKAARAVEKGEHCHVKEGGKDDYTSVKSYRPMSLLQTVSKILESVVG